MLANDSWRTINKQMIVRTGQFSKRLPVTVDHVSDPFEILVRDIKLQFDVLLSIP